MPMRPGRGYGFFARTVHTFCKYKILQFFHHPMNPWQVGPPRTDYNFLLSIYNASMMELLAKQLILVPCCQLTQLFCFYQFDTFFNSKVVEADVTHKGSTPVQNALNVFVDGFWEKRAPNMVKAHFSRLSDYSPPKKSLSNICGLVIYLSQCTKMTAYERDCKIFSSWG